MTSLIAESRSSVTTSTRPGPHRPSSARTSPYTRALFPISRWLAMPESAAYFEGPITTARETISARRLRFGRNPGLRLLRRRFLRLNLGIRRIQPPVPPPADHLAHAIAGCLGGSLGALADRAADHRRQQKVRDA